SQNDGTNGPVFSTFNGAWASLNGSVGPDPVLNQVLLAQITTDGTFSFSLNVQIRNQTTFVVENYVASNPIGSEILFPALNYNSDSTTSISEMNNQTSFGIYPNPVKDKAVLAISAGNSQQKTTYTIYDILGNIVAEKNLGTVSGISKHDIDVTSISSGIYFLELNVGGQLITRKMIKN
ncbi:MAG TPA: T9SS type A sorting domain-containing protein, partial [Bacteroidia bacterium]|nr:T9SS type A sorting domain-containing protein [Bacteroidia bacterium]